MISPDVSLILQTAARVALHAAGARVPVRANAKTVVSRFTTSKMSGSFTSTALTPSTKQEFAIEIVSLPFRFSSLHSLNRFCFILSLRKGTHGLVPLTKQGFAVEIVSLPFRFPYLHPLHH